MGDMHKSIIMKHLKESPTAHATGITCTVIWHLVWDLEFKKVTN